jgi:hypothetical protein
MCWQPVSPTLMRHLQQHILVGRPRRRLRCCATAAAGPSPAADTTTPEPESQISAGRCAYAPPT